MNLSQWGRGTLPEKIDHLKEICKQVQEGDMPLWYYKPMHPASWLSDSDKTALCDWTKAELAKLPPEPAGQGHSH